MQKFLFLVVGAVKYFLVINSRVPSVFAIKSHWKFEKKRERKKKRDTNITIDSFFF